MCLAVVGKLSLSAGVMHEEGEAHPGTGSGPLQHLPVAVGITEGHDGAAADVRVDADGFARLVVDERNPGTRASAGLPSRIT